MATWATKWWKKDSKKDSKTKASSYWYDDYSTDFDYADFYSDFKTGGTTVDYKSIQKSLDLYKLSATRRAVSNFVNIVTGQNIPVTFAGKNSYTDGKNVVISADIDDKFDVGVGLALHEGSHIVLSDFGLLKAVSDYTNALRVNDTTTINTIKSTKYFSILERMFDATNGLVKYITDGNQNSAIMSVSDTVMALNNWIEDRRIDNFIYRNAPGYRQYYLSMYDHYFNDNSITKGIDSDEYTNEDIDSYIFRIINLNNEKTKLHKLKGLRKIYGMLDLPNIGRLKSTEDSINLAISIVEEIYKNVGANTTQIKGKGQQQPGSGAGNGDMHIEDITDGESDEQGGSAGQIGNGMTGQASSQSTSSGKDGDSDTGSAGKITLSKTAAEKLKKMFEKQKAFLKGEVKKKNLSSSDAKSIASIDQSGGELVHVGNDVVHRGSAKGIDCVVLKKVTKATLDSNEFPFGDNDQVYYEKEVAEGTQLGKLLGNKLSVRSESRDTVYNRLNKGKIDQRLISGLGYGAESVFYNKETDQYNKANLHISLDYSGSMGGEKLRKTVVSTTAIVKAASMARNISVQVSIRSTTEHRGGGIKPMIAIIYDSRYNTFNDFCYMMERMHTTNTTPEGLCFEAIMKHFLPSTKDVDSYFLNFSDGEPAFTGNGFDYQGSEAARHTARQVKRIRECGINVLSYFISERSGESYAAKIFKECYGESARFIDTKNMNQVAKTMNEMFLKKVRQAA